MQKTKKRFLSALLACAMLISLFPFAAFADDASTKTVYVDTNVAASSGTTYKTLQEAVTAAGTNPTTIVLQSDVTLDATVNVSTGAKITVQSDSKNRTINYEATAGGNKAFGDLQSGTTLTVKNITFNVTGKENEKPATNFGIVVGEDTNNVTVNVDGCTFNNVYAGVYFGHLESGNTGRLSITNSTYNNSVYAYSVDEVTGNSAFDAVTEVTENNTLNGALNKEPWVYVTKDGSTKAYTTVQGAVNAAADGATITLEPGLYDERITVNKSLKFIGEQGAKVTDINVTGNGTQNVSFDGIAFVGSSSVKSNDVNNAALYLQSVASATVRNCTFELDEAYVTPGTAVQEKITAGEIVNNIAIVTASQLVKDLTVEGCTISGYDMAGVHNPAEGEESVTYKDNTIKDVPNGIEVYGITNFDVEGNTFENSNGVNLRSNWMSQENYAPTGNVTFTGNKFESYNGDEPFAVKVENTDSGAGYTGELDLNYNYWGSVSPDFNKLIQTNGNKNIEVVTDEYYRNPSMQENDLNTSYNGNHSYAITVADTDNGTISVDKYATEGEKVTITVTPDAGYMLDELTVTAGGKDVDVTDNGNGTYTFTMPSSKVKVAVTFVEDEDYVEPDTSITISMTIGSNDFVINNNIVTVPDAAPYIANDRTYVPFRALGEALGATVEWSDTARTVTYTLGDTEIVMTIGDTTYTINGVEKTMDVAPEITGDRTYVPVRFVAEGLGFKVTPLYAADGTTASVVFEK